MNDIYTYLLILLIMLIIFQMVLILKVRGLEIEMQKISLDEEKIFKDHLPRLLEEIERDADQIHSLYLKGQISDTEYKSAHRELLDLLEKIKEKYGYKK